VGDLVKGGDKDRREMVLVMLVLGNSFPENVLPLLKRIWEEIRRGRRRKSCLLATKGNDSIFSCVLLCGGGFEEKVGTRRKKRGSMLRRSCRQLPLRPGNLFVQEDPFKGVSGKKKKRTIVIKNHTRGRCSYTYGSCIALGGGSCIGLGR